MYVPSGQRGDAIIDIICSSFFSMENTIVEDAYDKKREGVEYKINQLKLINLIMTIKKNKI